MTVVVCGGVCCDSSCVWWCVVTVVCGGVCCDSSCVW